MSRFFSAESLETKTVSSPSGSPEGDRASEAEILDKNGSIMHLTCGLDANGDDYYAYMFIRPSLYTEFIKNSTLGVEFNLNDYGCVIKSGFGILPPEDVQKEMEEKFFFNHVFQDQFFRED